MAKYYYNGVLLPEIPADVLPEYPYCYIYLLNDGVTYRLMMSSKACYFTYDGYMYVYPRKQYEASIGSEEFTNEGYDMNEGRWSLQKGVVWSNHDIPNGSATSTAIYFYGSEPVPELPEPSTPSAETMYAIYGHELIAVADAIRGKTGKTTSLTLEQMVTEIEGIEAGGGGSIPANAKLYYVGNAVAMLDISCIELSATATGKSLA